MSEQEEIIRNAFSRYIEDKHPAGSVADVAQLLASGSLSSAALDEVIADDYAFFREGMLDLIAYFVELCLDDHVLTTEERLAAKQLKRLLHIKEGDLWGLRRREVEELVGREVDRILASGMVDQAEALYQAHLQEVFDLSYDQYLEVSRRFVDRIVDEKIQKLAASGAGPRERIQQLVSLITLLDTVYKLRKSKKEELLAPPLPPARQQSPLVG